MKSKVILFLTGFLQVSLVSAQTFFIASRFILGIILCGFAISLVWTINVKRVAFGGWIDRIIYASGASAGAVVGFILADWMVK